jgi:hypothetical protein
VVKIRKIYKGKLPKKRVTSPILFHRTEIGMKRVDGEVRLLAPSPITPLIITHERHAGIQPAIASGQRAALVLIEGVDYKIKGCAIEEACRSDKAYDNHHVIGVPEGGQTWRRAIHELKVTNEYNELMEAEGFEPVHEPTALILYNKQFSLMPEDAALNGIAAIYQILRHPFSSATDLFYDVPSISSDRLAASVMKIKGDTRLPEVGRMRVRNQRMASGIVYSLGLAAGAQKRITEQRFFWYRGDAHAGNYVVFPHNGMLHLAMCDFEWSNMSDTHGKLRSLFERRAILKTIKNSGESLVEGFLWGVMQPDYFIQNFTAGFTEGYRRPDKREPIPLTEVLQAYAFPSTTHDMLLTESVAACR